MNCSTLRAPSAVLICKSCRCGQSFTADQWLDLKPIGLMDGDDDTTLLDLRNCPCGSTLAAEVSILGLIAPVMCPSSFTTLPAPEEES